MNVLSPVKVKALRDALESGASIRKAARLAGVNRNTAHRYSKILDPKKRHEHRSETITIKISPAAKVRLSLEARSMVLSLTNFGGLLLETIAEDNLFGAVLDA